MQNLKPSRGETLRHIATLREQVVRAARTSFPVFCEFVMRDELTRKPIVLAPIHHSWSKLLDQHDRLVLLSHVEAGKTFILSIARTLFELGQNPSLRNLVISHTQHQARAISSIIKSYIESSDELHEVFPKMLPGSPWGEFAFSVERASRAKDPSVQVCGIGGNILGARLDRVVGDDVLDHMSTRTDDGRKATVTWWDATVTGRMVQNSRSRIVGTPWHPADMLHVLAKRPGWHAFKYPIHIDGVSRWPDRWPWARIEAKARELGPLETQRQLMCEARDDATARFPRAAVELALQLGEGTSLCSALAVVPPGYKTYTGVDLAVQEKDEADTTCLFTIAVDPYGTRSLLSIERGRWSGPDIVRRIISCHRRFQSIVWVENNAAQDFIRQWVLAGETIPIQGFTTGRNKAHPEFGIESIATEMAAGKWKIPNEGGICHPDVQTWVDEMLYYSLAAHTGDALMACYFAREGARRGSLHVGPVSGMDLTRR